MCCLPESFLYWGVKGSPDQLCEETAAELPRIISAGSGFGAGLLVPYLLQEQDKFYSVVQHFSVDGRAGTLYRKRNPWIQDMTCGTTEHTISRGREVVAFDSPGGYIGAQVCFDVNFEMGWSSLARLGCRLILFPSDYPGGFALRVRAWQSSAVVAAAVCRGGPSPVIDITGEIICLRTVNDNSSVLAINLNRARVHVDLSHTLLSSFRRCCPEVVVRRLQHDNVYQVIGPPEGLDVRLQLRDFGIETEQEYLQRSAGILEQIQVYSDDSNK